jgi:hypothetical protein
MHLLAEAEKGVSVLNELHPEPPNPVPALAEKTAASFSGG